MKINFPTWALVFVAVFVKRTDFLGTKEVETDECARPSLREDGLNKPHASANAR